MIVCFGPWAAGDQGADGKQHEQHGRKHVAQVHGNQEGQGKIDARQVFDGHNDAGQKREAHQCRANAAGGGQPQSPAPEQEIGCCKIARNGKERRPGQVMHLNILIKMTRPAKAG